MNSFGYTKSFNVKAVSLAIVFSLVAYYAIIVFHLRQVIELFRGTRVGFIGLLLFFLPALVMKGGFAVRVYRAQGSLRKAIRFFTLISFYILLLVGTMAGVIAAATWLSMLKAGEYWHESHWFWVALIVFLLFAYGYLILKQFGLIRWQLLKDLGAVPIVSPIFCFGGPYLWSQNLKYASLNPRLLNTYSTLTMLAGAIFLVYVCGYAILNQKFGIVGSAASPSAERKAASVLLAVLAAGLYLFLVVILDIITTLVMR